MVAPPPVASSPATRKVWGLHQLLRHVVIARDEDEDESGARSTASGKMMGILIGSLLVDSSPTETIVAFRVGRGIWLPCNPAPEAVSDDDDIM